MIKTHKQPKKTNDVCDFMLGVYQNPHGQGLLQKECLTYSLDQNQIGVPILDVYRNPYGFDIVKKEGYNLLVAFLDKEKTLSKSCPIVAWVD